ncbi:MAG TPA: hypothetical protein VM240_07920 [Verrucomicrobiae bacterium]|nr:hypothetical protein [Verrucomicrobiae bacterium]
MRFHVILLAALLGATFPLHADESRNETRELREEIREKRQALREDERELRQRERRRRERAGPGPMTVSLGMNVAHVDGADQNCAGSQAALTLGGRAFVRGEIAEMSYEDRDGAYACDGPFGGDSGVDERSLLGGMMLGRSGFFVAGGLSHVDYDRSGVNGGVYGDDTGGRYEFGWNSRFANGAPAGFEILMFKNDNDLRDFHGVAVNVAFGPTR